MAAPLAQGQPHSAAAATAHRPPQGRRLPLVRVLQERCRKLAPIASSWWAVRPARPGVSTMLQACHVHLWRDSNVCHQKCLPLLS